MDETSIFSITVALSKNPNYINTLLEKKKILVQYAEEYTTEKGDPMVKGMWLVFIFAWSTVILNGSKRVKLKSPVTVHCYPPLPWVSKG